MKSARFTKHARSELLAQTAYYEASQHGLGARFRKEVEAAALRCATRGDLPVTRKTICKRYQKTAGK